MNELAVSVGDAYQDQPVGTVYIGPGQGHDAAFEPGSAIAMGFDDLKVIEAYNFLAMAHSAETGTWVKVART
jgi:hypothetical protein